MKISLPYPKYKPSGKEWLGEIPEHWELLRLKYATNLINQKIDGEKCDLPYTGLEHIESWTGKRIVNEEISSSGQTSIHKSGDVLLGKLRPYLAKVYASQTDGICTGELLVLRPRVLLQAFLCNYLLNPDFISLLDSSTYGAKMPRANWDFIGDLQALIPPIEEQRTIANYLDQETARIDKLIEKKERQIELLREKRSALISHAVTKGLDSIFKMKDSGIEWLGKIPEHWEVSPLKFSLKPRRDAVKTGPFGSQLLSSEMETGTIKVYNQRNVLDRDFNSGDNFITIKKYQELKSFTIFPGDVIITTRGTIGQCALFPDNAKLGILHPCLIRIQVNSNIILPEYLSLLIRDGCLVLLQLKLMSNATTIDVIYSEPLKSVRLPLPPIQEQHEILSWTNQELIKIDTLLKTIHKSISLLREYRMTLISATVTGKIDVRKEVA